MRMLVVFLRRTIGARVVLIAVDVAAHLILLVIHLSVFLPRQVPTVRCAIVVHFLVNVRFLVFQVAGFARRELARANALSDASLLIAFTRVHVVQRGCCWTSVIFRREVRMV